MRIKLLIVLFIACQLLVYSQSYTPGKSYFGRNNYIEYIAGNLPVIISVPHGGALTPAEISDRTCGDETVTDSYTIDLAREIKDAIYSATGCFPHIIINNLKRTKLDANRDLQEAACGNLFAETAWHDFQNYIDTASSYVTKKSGKGLYIDLHGHGHTIQRLELGYLLTTQQLSNSEATLNSTTYVNYSSIRNLINTNISNLSHTELLRGNFSLGSMFAAKGFPAVPSNLDPFPLTGQTYFTGGYNTLTHGSKNSGTIDGIQIECNQDVRFIESARKEFASKFAVILLDYLKTHYFSNLPQTYCNVSVDKMNAQEISIFPNPFGNILNIMNSTPADLYIYDFLGTTIAKIKIGTKEKIDLSYLNNGIYMIIIKVDGRIIHREKIIKNL